MSNGQKVSRKLRATIAGTERIRGYGHLGYDKEAKEVRSELRLHRPDFSIEKILKITPYKNRDHLSFIADALRKAGLPD